MGAPVPFVTVRVTLELALADVGPESFRKVGIAAKKLANAKMTSSPVCTIC
jgi:hypothetical protein